MPDPCLIHFPHALEEAVFLERRKRFLVQVRQGRSQFWIHTNNSGSMMGLLKPGRPVLMSRSDNPRRKYPFTLEAIQLDSGWCGVNTSMPNRILRALFRQRLFPVPEAYVHFSSEVSIKNSRLDGLMTTPNGRRWWLEAKNVTLVEEDTAYFPDAVTTRGARHLVDLSSLVGMGDRASCVYIVQHPEAKCFAPADFIDPDYAKAYTMARQAGVDMWAFQTCLGREGIQLVGRMAVP